MMEKMTQQEINKEYFLKIAIALTPPEHKDHVHITIETFKNLIQSAWISGQCEANESAWMNGQCEANERKYINERV